MRRLRAQDAYRKASKSLMVRVLSVQYAHDIEAFVAADLRWLLSSVTDRVHRSFIPFCF